MASKSFKTERFNILNLLRTFVFGKNEIRQFSPSIVYNKNDFMYLYDEATQSIRVLRCLEDGTTGVFDEARWTSDANASSGHSIVLSDVEPTDTNTAVWYEPVNK